MSRKRDFAVFFGTTFGLVKKTPLMKKNSFVIRFVCSNGFL
jgi:hypothetical protein